MFDGIRGSILIEEIKRKAIEEGSGSANVVSSKNKKEKWRCTKEHDQKWLVINVVEEDIRSLIVDITKLK